MSRSGWRSWSDPQRKYRQGRCNFRAYSWLCSRYCRTAQNQPDCLHPFRFPDAGTFGRGKSGSGNRKSRNRCHFRRENTDAGYGRHRKHRGICGRGHCKAVSLQIYQTKKLTSHLYDGMSFFNRKILQLKKERQKPLLFYFNFSYLY